VLLVDDSYEIVVPVEQLPEGAEGGTWVRVQFDGDKLVSATIE
jgi:hypothetical protein